MSAPAATNLDRTFAALADPARRGVVDLLRKRPRRASELADKLSLTRPAMSRHLRVLRRTGLVTEQELPDDARVRMYQIEPQAFRELRGWLEEVEAFWGDQLHAFKRHAERPGKKA